MPDSIPQWVTNIESDERIYKKKRFWYLTFLLIEFIVFIWLAIYFNNVPSMRSYISLFFIITFMPLFFAIIGIQKPDRPNLLAANLYHIGAELEAFESTSPSYIERNLNYLKNCQKIINDLIIVNEEYFIEDYLKFLKNLENTILRLNYLYLRNSRPNNPISNDLKELAESIHDDYRNLKPVHTQYVNGILSNLQNVQPLALATPLINRLYNSFNAGWCHISYSYRATITLLVIGIIIFAAAAIFMIYALSMEKSQSYGYAIVGSMTLIAGLITQIDKIVPREKIKFS